MSLAAQESGYFVRFGARAMACRFEVLIPADGKHAASAAVFAALERIGQLESQLTVYRETSEIAAINRLAAHAPVPVERGLFDLLKLSRDLWRDTQGAFDITAGPLIEAWGFQNRAGKVPSGDELSAARDRVGMQHVELNDKALTVRFLRQGLALNLGAIGKGYALDCVSDDLRLAGLTRFAWHAGQSSLRCAGAEYDDNPQGGWSVGVGHPLRPGRHVAHVRVRDRALATSAAGVQFFRQDGRRYGHLIDPRSGCPAEGVLSVTVLAPSAAQADALSTALFVLGPDGSTEYFRNHPEIKALWVLPGERAGQTDLHTVNLAADEWQTA